MTRPQRSLNDATGYEYFKKYTLMFAGYMIKCQLKLASKTNYWGKELQMTVYLVGPSRSAFVSGNANLEMFLPPNCRSMHKISHETDTI